jgi:hypothetical protein
MFAKSLLRSGSASASRSTSPRCVVPLEQFNLPAIKPSPGVLQLLNSCLEPCHLLVMPFQALNVTCSALAIYFDLDVCNGHALTSETTLAGARL